MPRAAHSRKKARTKKVTVGETSRHAFNWPKLPCDVQFEIYNHLTQADLLNLARTNKETYRLLCLPQAAVYWERARANTGDLPPCPPWRGEMQFAFFINDSCCVICSRVDDHSRTPLWEFDTRYCSDCEASRTTTENPFHGLPDGEYKTAFSSQAETIFPRVYHNGVVLFHLPDVTQFREDILSAQQEVQQMYVVHQRLLLTEKRRQHAIICKDWKKRMDKLETERRQEVQYARYKQIVGRLNALGYDEELRNLGINLEGLTPQLRRFFDKPEPLSERDWKLTLPELEKALQHRRVLEQRRCDVSMMLSRLRNLDESLEDYIDDQPSRDDGIWPRALDLFDLNAVRHLVELDHLIFVPSVSYDHMIPHFVAAWREARQATLLALLPGVESRPAIPSTSSAIMTRSMAPQPSPLELPQAIFWCVHCQELVSGPQAMQHTCCYAFAHGWETINPDTVPYIDGAYSPLVMEGVDILARTCLVHARGLNPWSPAPLCGCSDIVKDIWAALGFDVTARDAPIEVVNEMRVACSACSVSGQVMVTMDWRGVVHHTFEVHDGVPVAWFKPCQQVQEKVKRVEYAFRDDSAMRAQTSLRWRCKWCDWPQSVLSYHYYELPQHYQENHPMCFIHVSPSLDSPEYQHPPVVLCETNLPEDNINLFVTVFEHPSWYIIESMRFPRDAWVGMLVE
ncbi:hypothetical protein L227DRAFT_605648 [Lentinus tigrinus ALCF2SS1-6]|uniref:F-box domain-containing protein n=1 Tax=Lentinus tigrinus ALCF2SS1-6 TaxID=1328759 RepID=A0A5C2SWW0_9APHY|nr:hypothetical protein L227DRAFT_605648 [Lentinus tigrinus ALCF2SS1-6]